MEKETTFIKIVFAVAIVAAIITGAFCLNALYVDYTNGHEGNDTVVIKDVPVVDVNIYDFKK